MFLYIKVSPSKQTCVFRSFEGLKYKRVELYHIYYIQLSLLLYSQTVCSSVKECQFYFSSSTTSSPVLNRAPPLITAFKNGLQTENASRKVQIQQDVSAFLHRWDCCQKSHKPVGLTVFVVQQAVSYKLHSCDSDGFIISNDCFIM